MRDRPFPDAYHAFVTLFNQGDYWESHEVLEDAWRDTDSAFYQGLILLASAFVHVARRNAHGVRAQAAKAEARLVSFRPSYLGLDVAALLEVCESARAAVDRGAWPDAPRLVLDPALARGDEPEWQTRPPGAYLRPMVSAIVLLSVAHDHINEVAEAVADMDGVTAVYSVAGRFDLVAVLRVKRNEDLAELVTARMLKAAHITHAETLIAFRVFSRRDVDAAFSLGGE